MLNIISNLWKPKGYVRLRRIDACTGVSELIIPTKSPLIKLSDVFIEKLYKIKQISKQYKKNTATLTASKVSANLIIPRPIGQPDPYKFTRFEWGSGFSSPENPRDIIQLNTPFSPAIHTTIEAYASVVSEGNIIQMSSTLREELPNISNPGTAIIRELAIKTDPIPANVGGTGIEITDGAVVAYYVHDSNITKSAANEYIGAEWLYIYN